MASQYVKLPLTGGGGGGGAVDSFNGRTGIVVSQTGDYGASIISNNPAGTISSTTVQGAINELDADIQANIPTGAANTFAGFDGTGALESIPGFNIDANSGGMNEQLTEQPNNVGGGYTANTLQVNFDPLQNSPNDAWNINNIGANFDVSSSGFTQGTSGEAVTINSLNITNTGTGNIGGIVMTKNYFNLGNGTDPITVNGMTYSYGFGDINSGVTMLGSVQGYGFQPNFHTGSTLNQSVTAFYDNSNINGTSEGHTSYQAGVNITTLGANRSYTGVGIGPNIATMASGANATGVGVYPQIGTMSSTSSFAGVSVNPIVTLNNNYVAGIDVNMNNVTNFAGVKASVTIQDLHYEINEAGTFNNSFTIEYTNTVLAGNEVATLSGQAITVQIESGVSTATQVIAAINANLTLAGGVTITVVGVASNPQVAVGPTNFAGGVDAGRKLAANFVGDVSIDGALSFTGGLSIGALSSFATKDLATLPPGVNSIDTLITQPSVAANATVSGIDLLGINTAMLLTIGDNATLTSNFLGIAALGLPAVVSMGSGSSIDRVEGAVFAISLDSGAAGGTISEVDLCRALAIPNGVTSVASLKAYEFDLPFGDPGTTTWGVYMTPTCHNYMAGDLLVGGTAGSDDVVENSSVGIELDSTTKAILLSRMTTTERDALTAVNGMLIYNITLNKFQGYEAGAWVNLI